MPRGAREHARSALVWAGLALVALLPVVAAAMSPLLAWRDPIYVIAGFAGILGLVLILFQPLLVAGILPGLASPRGRRMHRWAGLLLIFLVLVHVGGLWVTSPPDVVDALLFVSPTPFSLWGVIAMWAVFAAAAVAILRRRLRVRWSIWRGAHVGLVAVTLAGTILHALLVVGAMEPVTRALLCIASVAAFARALHELRAARRVRSRTLDA
jgi:predicted ferric reductase